MRDGRGGGRFRQSEVSRDGKAGNKHAASVLIGRVVSKATSDRSVVLLCCLSCVCTLSFG